MLDVTVVHGEEGLQSIASDWHQLLARLTRRRFYHAYGWIRSYLVALHDKSSTLSFYIMRRGNTPMAIVPLTVIHRHRFGLPAREITLPQHSHLPLGDILCDPQLPAESLLMNLVTALHDAGHSWDMLVFGNVMEASVLSTLHAGPISRTLLLRAKTCNYIACDRPYPQIVKSFSTNFRSNLSKARNKLAKEPAVEFLSVTDGEEVQHYFKEFLEIEASGWRGEHGAGTAIKLHPDLLRFYESLIAEFSPSHEVMVNCLRIGGQAVAAQFCLLDEDTLYVLKLAYHEGRARLAPGNMLLERVIQLGVGGGFSFVNLVGDPAWFKDWQPVGTPVYHLYVFNRTPIGLALLTAMSTKERLRPWYEHLRGRSRT